MSRAGYIDDCDEQWQLIMWRGAVMSAIRGRRGQAFLQEMLTALDALPEKKLISGDLEADGEVCAIGAVGRRRQIDMSKFDPDDYGAVAGAFGIAEALAREIEFENDEGSFRSETPEQRYVRIYAWVERNIMTATVIKSAKPKES